MKQGPEMMEGDGVRGIPMRLPFSRSMVPTYFDPGENVGRVVRLAGGNGVKWDRKLEGCLLRMKRPSMQGMVEGLNCC